MTKNTITHIMLLILLSMACIPMQGCFVIGYGVGSLIDKSPTDAALLQDLKRHQGSMVQIVTKDSIRNATFVGYDEEPDSSYIPRYTSFEFDKHLADKPIKLGDSITIVDQYGRQNFRFNGYPAILDREMDTLFNRSAESRMSSEKLKTKFSRSELINLMALNAVPIRATLHFVDYDADFRLTNSDFKNAWCKDSHNTGKITGLVIGAFFDLVALVFFRIEPATFKGATRTKEL